MTEREQWLEQRMTGIGGSEAASVFNVGWGCRRRLAYEKRRIEPDYPFDETLIMGLGSLMEPWFAEQYVEKTGRTVSAPSSFSHPKHPEMRVNIDRLIEPVQEKPGRGVLEIKSQGRAVFSKTRREGISEGYILQVQWGLTVTGLDWGSFAIGCRDSGELVHWDVPRDASICNEMLDAGPKLWAQIQDPNAELPERLEVDDPRCSSCGYRKMCQGNALIHVSGKSDLIPAEDIRPLLAEYDRWKPLYEEAEAGLEETKEALRSALVDRPAVCVGAGKKDRKVYFRSQAGRTTWETEELVKKYEALRTMYVAQNETEYPPAEKFKREGLPFRVLRIY